MLSILYPELPLINFKYQGKNIKLQNLFMLWYRKLLLKLSLQILVEKNFLESAFYIIYVTFRGKKILKNIEKL